MEKGTDIRIKSVTLVITSCGRLNLLQRTIESLWQYYQFPKERFIIIEDSAKNSVTSGLMDLYGHMATLVINSKNIGLIASVDKAYTMVQTPYIFHCEDDWSFYRPGFIEESIAMLEADPKLKQVSLRSIHHDYIVHHPMDIDPKRLFIASNACYKLKIQEGINKEEICTSLPLEQFDWSCFSFNPGIVRKSDYNLLGKYGNVVKPGENKEGNISSWYKERGYYMVALENDAVLHTGWGLSTEGNDPPNYVFKKRFKNALKAFLNLFGFNWKYEKG